MERGGLSNFHYSREEDRRQNDLTNSTHDFVRPFNLSTNGISAASSNSSLASGPSELGFCTNTSTAAGGGSERRFGLGGIWDHPTPITDEMIFVDRSPAHDSSVWRQFNVFSYDHTIAPNCVSREERFFVPPDNIMRSPTTMDDVSEASQTDDDFPPYCSIAPIQSTNFGSVCTLCRLQHCQSIDCLCSCHGGQSRESNTSIINPRPWDGAVNGGPVMRRQNPIDNQRTPTKSIYGVNPAHPGFPSLTVPLTDSLEIPNYFGGSSLRFNPVTGSVSGHSNGEPRNSESVEITPPSPSPLELTGDVRTANLHSHDHRPLRTWL